MYEKYFGLNALPFPSTPDQNIFYPNAMYEAVSSKLEHGLITKSGVMLLTGATGTGKTALVRKLFADLGSTFQAIWLSQNEITFADVLRSISTQLDAAAKSAESTALLDALYPALRRTKDDGTVVALIIEEAQDLNAEMIEGLRRLSNLEADGEKLLQLILVGQPKLMEKLDEPQNYRFKQRVALHCRLFPLTRSEVERYIAFRMRAVGHTDVSVFEPEAIARIAHYSGGIPRLINFLCGNALMAACRSSRKEISGRLIDAVADDMGMPAGGPDLTALNTAPKLARPRTKDETAQKNPATEQFPREDAPLRASRGRAARAFPIALLSFLMVVGLGLALYSADRMNFSRLFEAVQQMAENQTSPTAGAEVSGAEQKLPPDLPSTLAPQPEDTAPQMESSTPLPRPDEEKTNQAQHPSEPRPTKTIKATKNSAEEAVPVIAKVQKAIQNRAIEGVSVRLSNGTVHLGGRVATSRQKALAEKAALSVAGGLRLENHINVDNPD
jgi:type II secretory pathway predicted ATPase ExeA